MKVNGEYRPRDEGPGLLGVPAPVPPPRLVCPGSPREYAEGEERESEEHEPVGGIVKALELILGQAVGGRPPPENGPAYLYRGGYDEDGVREEGEYEVPLEPAALQ